MSRAATRKSDVYLTGTRMSGKRARRSYVHRNVVAQRLGRRLDSREVVHHINGNRRDNRPDNLIALSSQRAHMLLHNRQWREERGIIHLFPLDEILRIAGDSLVWATPAGAKAVFDH